MPPKSATCSLCGALVLKAQTYARPDGSRACRSHEGVSEEAEARRQADRDRISHEIEHPKRKPWAQDPAEALQRMESYQAQAEKFREHAYTHCWACDGEGLGLREFFWQVRIAMERLQMRGEFDFFTFPTEARKLLGNLKALCMLPYQNEVIDKALRKHLQPKLRDVVPLLGQVFLCAECAKKHGYWQRWEALIPKPTFEQIQNVGMVADAILQPVIQAEAVRQEKAN